jgi:hypothetical protein
MIFEKDSKISGKLRLRRNQFPIQAKFSYNVWMRSIFILLSIFAALLTILIVGLTIVSIAVGGGSVLFPGLGLVVSLPFLIVLLAVFDAAIIFLAMLFGRISRQQKMP